MQQLKISFFRLYTRKKALLFIKFFRNYKIIYCPHPSKSPSCASGHSSGDTEMVSRGLEVILKIKRLGQHFAQPCTPSIIVLDNLFVLFQSPFVKTRISCFPITEELYNTTSLIQLSREYLNSSLQSSTIVYLANNKPSILYNNMNWFIKTVVPLILWNIIIFRPIYI